MRPLDAEVCIVGAGISGIGTAIALQDRGIDDVVLLERADDLGGTWRDNTYPGVAVDIPSSSYCFSFATDWPWSRAYAEGHEILDYVRHVAETHGVVGRIRYGCEVVRSRFDDAAHVWVTELTDGSTVTSRYLVSGTGLFTTPVLPDIEGLDTFAGTAFHSARWDHDHDLSGRRVGVIGTGASAVQIVPSIAPQVAQLSVFQRTPIWVSPRPDYPLPPASSRRNLRRFGPVRDLAWWGSEAGIELLTYAATHYRRVPGLTHVVQRLVRRWMASQVSDPATRDALIPDYTLGCKRPASSNTYLKTFDAPHVALVTEPIARIEPAGVRTADGTLHEVDTLVLATGFETTQKGNNPAFEVIGTDGVELGDFWDRNRLQAWQGVAVTGWPNLWLTAGPYSGGFNWFAQLEAHLQIIVGAIVRARERGATRVEVRREALDAYMAEMWRYAEQTVFRDASCGTANSYYLDRHGDAALPLPRTPWWRVRRFRQAGLDALSFR